LNDLLTELEVNLSCLTTVLSRPYWTRVWVFREMALATKLVCMCGSETITKDELFVVQLLSDKVGRIPGLRRPVKEFVAERKRVF
jgi:hypothetical protein